MQLFVAKKQQQTYKQKIQNEYNKVIIELRVVQFWSDIKLANTNHTPATRSCDFVIARLISDQIALHLVQLPLFNIAYVLIFRVFIRSRQRPVH